MRMRITILQVQMSKLAKFKRMPDSRRHSLSFELWTLIVCSCRVLQSSAPILQRYTRRRRENADEEEHLEVPGPACFPDRDRPGIDEHGFEIEDDEEHGDQVELDMKAQPGGCPWAQRRIRREDPSVCRGAVRRENRRALSWKRREGQRVRQYTASGQSDVVAGAIMVKE